jgi:hypothetical protein
VQLPALVRRHHVRIRRRGLQHAPEGFQHDRVSP